VLKKEDKLPINPRLPLTISEARKEILRLLESKKQKRTET
jgi:hypothetical protein